MPGSQAVFLTVSSRFKFRVKAKPDIGWRTIWARIPVLGPFFLFKLGRTLRFRFDIEYLGYDDGSERPLYRTASVSPQENEWHEDLVLMHEGEAYASGDLWLYPQTLIASGAGHILSKEFFLTRSGDTEVQIGTEFKPCYTFHVREITHSLTPVMITTTFALLGILLGFFLGRVG